MLQTAYNNMLLKAAQEGDLDSVAKALRVGADINCVDSDGCTPLILASQLPDENVYVYLVQEGADPSIVDGFGMKASDYLLTVEELEDLEEDALILG